MNCGRYEEWIALDAGGDLPRKEAERLRHHLAECAPCRDFAQALAAARTEFQAIADEEIDETDLAAVRRGVRAHLADERTHRFGFGWRWALAGAAAMLLVAGLWLAPTGVAPSNRAATVMERQRITGTGPNSNANRTATVMERQRPDAATESVASATVRQQRTRAQQREPQPAASETAVSHQRGPVRATPSVVAVSPDVVRIQTPDPNVVVYWVLATKEAEEDVGDES